MTSPKPSKQIKSTKKVNSADFSSDLSANFSTVIDADSEQVLCAWNRPQSPDNSVYILKQGQLGHVDKLRGIQKSKRSQSVLMKKSGKSGLVQYDPFHTHLDLYRQFGSLGLEETALVDFANHYGLLGLSESASIKGLKGFRPVESIDSWRKEIMQLASLLDLWECLRPGGDSAGLKARIIWHKESKKSKDAKKSKKPLVGIYHYYKNPMDVTVEGKGQILLSDDYPQLFERMKYGDLVEPAWIHVRSTINQQLRKHTSLQLLGKVTESNGGKLNAKPNNLLGVLWLQFAYEVAGLRVYSPCANCNKAMVEPIKRGQIRKTCSDACRQAVSRRARE